MKSKRKGLFTYVLLKPPPIALIDCKLFCLDVANSDITLVGSFDTSSFSTESFHLFIAFYVSHTYILVALFVFTPSPLLIVFMVLHATALDVLAASNEEITHAILLRPPTVH